MPPGSKSTRRDAARLLNIEEDVLKVWGNLATNRGEGIEKRKSNGNQRPFTQQESDWLLAALRRAARQVGRYKAGAKLTPIEMKDLPPL